MGKLREISGQTHAERDAESAYYINNLHVRRRDIADIFLGTGLGARAYAIIEQGMISRIIEAKPEELRIFLEEAAGVSKYRERRRETELRLADTRENLLRVEDIRLELDKQLEHLREQAEVATQYHSLQRQLHIAQNLLWLQKKREAGSARERCARDIAKLGIELEAEMARLRDTERRLEELRERHHTAGEALHAAQGSLYEPMPNSRACSSRSSTCAKTAAASALAALRLSSIRRGATAGAARTPRRVATGA
jgi:chromosome segregation protein